MTRTLPALRPLTLGLTRRQIGSFIFAGFVVYAALSLAAAARPYGALALLGAWAAVAFANRPLGVAATVGTSAFLQLCHIGIVYADQVDLGQAAFGRVLTGQSPYGVMYTNDIGGLNPFAYGPLALLTSLGGRPLEFVAHLGVLGLLAWQRAWITLGVMAAGPMVLGSTLGGNDGVPALLLGGALVVMQTRPRLGMAGLAIAAAVKPHIAAWFVPMIGFAGWTAGAWLIGASALLWSPLLVWGLGTYIESARMVYGAGEPTTGPTLGVNVPVIRLLALPVALAGILVRRWDRALLLGSAVYVMVMFFGSWAHWGYATAPVVAAGLAVESRRAE